MFMTLPRVSAKLSGGEWWVYFAAGTSGNLKIGSLQEVQVLK